MVLSASRRDRACAVASGAFLEARRSPQSGDDLDSRAGIAIRAHSPTHLGAIIYSPSAEVAARTDDRRSLPIGAQSSLHRQCGDMRERDVFRPPPVDGSLPLAVGFRGVFDRRPLRRGLASGTL